MKVLAMTTLMFCTMVQASQAGLIGTEVMLESFFQSTASSPAERLIFLTTAIVKEPGIEFPSIKALEVNNPQGLGIVDRTYNIGDDFVEMGFSNSAPFTSFQAGFFNGPILTFNSTSVPSIVSAVIDRSVTTLGLSDSDVTFSGNKLSINVEGLHFNQDTFARINLTVQGGPPTPVPIPAAVWLFGSGLAVLWGFSKRKQT